MAEFVDRLANQYHCEIHLYSERVEDLALSNHGMRCPADRGTIIWHCIPAVPAPHLVRFIAWMILNSLLRTSHRLLRGVSFDLVLSPGINTWNADVVIVHALFHRLQELAGSDGRSQGMRHKPRFLRSLHRRAYYGLLTALERRTYSNHKVSLLAVSQRTASLLQRYFQRDDVSVVPNGVDLTEFSAPARVARRSDARERRQLQPDDLVLLLIGNDWRVKGLPAILAAMAALPDLPLRLIVVGQDDVTPFRDTAERLGVLPHCLWEEPRRDVIDLYAAADIYVSPSLEDSFALPVAEAMACGLPAITSVFAGISTRIHHGVDGFVLRDPNDAKPLAQLLERLHRDTDFRYCIGEAAARTAQDWSWDHSAAVLWDVLQRTARQKQSPAAR
jgi:UDP-glucose:(heptosyl)LPS alpha-1,3-glucosyltransferase